MTKLAINQVDKQHFTLVGELTRNSIGEEQILDKMLLNEHKTYYFDLCGVSRVDTAGLAWLIHSFAEFKRQGINLELQNPPEQLRNLMQLGLVTTLFE